MTEDRSWARAADRLGRDAAAEGEPTRWVEELWSSAERDEIDTPWDHAGWETVAFDISPAAVRLVTQRYPDTEVDYRTGDLLDLADDMVGAFDLVVEVFTVQAMPPTVRPQAVEGIRRLLAPGGTAVVVQFVRGDTDPDDGPPWLLDQAEMESFGRGDVSVADLETRPGPRADRDEQVWVATLRRA